MEPVIFFFAGLRLAPLISPGAGVLVREATCGILGRGSAGTRALCWVLFVSMAC